MVKTINVFITPKLLRPRSYRSWLWRRPS